LSTSSQQRMDIFRRDNFTCRVCGLPYPPELLVAHHALFRREGGEDDPKNLVTVCRRCHARLHRRP